MSDLEITILCFALTLGIIGFFVGAIYNTKEIKKLNDKIDKEINGFNRHLKILNNSIYGNFDNDNRRSIASRVAQLELNEDKTGLNITLLQVDVKDCKVAINKLAKHTNYSKSNII